MNINNIFHYFGLICSLRSIVCLNMPSFPSELDPWGKPNFRRKKKRNFTSSFVDDELLRIIGFRDDETSWGCNFSSFECPWDLSCIGTPNSL
ncbi:unnamed protein product, partial [Vitis vinifera]|uniref:Uncharacterized protein n=1 Tax=Vitis vinifera TaxID=29760 RepID=D7TG44_VITVI